MGSLMRTHQWENTPLGAPSQWPQSLRTVVNILLTSRYAMWMGWGPALSFLYNDAYRPTLGLKHPWALGSPTTEVWAEIWRDIGPRIEAVLSTGEATYDEGLLLILERSGFREETYHTFSYSPLSDDQGRINGMLCVVTEETERIISERRMATLRDLASGLAASSSEAEVRTAVEQQLSANVRDLPFALTYLYDGTGAARLVCRSGISAGSPDAPEALGSESALPWPAKELYLHPEPRIVEGAGKGWSLDSADGSGWDIPPEQAAIVPIKQQGQERPAGFLVVGLSPYRRYDAAYSGFVDLIAGQIAAGLANARAYEEERRRAEALAELDLAKTAFFSNVSHEFRTPLTLMLGPVEDILAKPEDEIEREILEVLKVVHRSGLRLQRLVNTLLDFSRIEAGRAQASYAPTDLAVLTAELASTFRSAMERAGLQFSVECGPLSQPVYIDREMWEKIVLNLVSNALKYTLEGSVSVRLGEGGGGAELAVTDTGVGIPENELPHVFERFHRVEGTRGRTHEGTGIGLALVQELVKLHGGTVKAASAVGQGSTFSVTLPFGSSHLPKDRLGAGRDVLSTELHADTFIEEALRWLPEPEGVYEVTAELAGAASNGARSRVLLAEDNADMRDYLRRLLSERYRVTVVSNGDEARIAAIAQPPDLVLTDVMMPVLDGFGLLKALRSHSNTKTLPIILLSARAGEESRIEGLDAGADDYLVKPFAARELLARVEAHLSLARMRKQADEARKISELRLGLTLEATKMFAWEWDPQADTVVGSGDMQSIFGAILPSAVSGFRLVHPEDLPWHKAKVERVSSEGGSYHSEFRIRRADSGVIAWLEERATAITDEAGVVQRVVGVIGDVTERKLAEEEMRRKNDELTKANRELEEFAYVASHDLQEPLRMVNIYSQLLLRSHEELRATPQTAEYAEFVRKGVFRMETLIRDLLEYSRVVHPEQDEPELADLNKSLDEALAMLHARIEECGATVVRTPLPSVLGDERQLASVFQNLISNALKYSRNGTPPRVEMAVEERQSEWVISVKDNGIGFDPKHAERIFGLFKRLHKEAYPGTGLGLAICKRIVERYGGRIWATSAGEGRGAVFTFALPKANA